MYHPLADKFGFTASEVETLLTYYKINDSSKQIQQWYDGYTFGNKAEILIRGQY